MAELKRARVVYPVIAGVVGLVLLLFAPTYLVFALGVSILGYAVYVIRALRRAGADRDDQPTLIVLPDGRYEPTPGSKASWWRRPSHGLAATCVVAGSFLLLIGIGAASTPSGPPAGAVVSNPSTSQPPLTTSSPTPTTLTETTTTPPPTTTTEDEEVEADPDEIPQPTFGRPVVVFKNCKEARRAGFAPLFRGDPGYRRGLDRDGDGVACD